MYLKALAFYCLFMIYVDKVSSNVFISSVTSSPSKFVKCSSFCEKTFPLISNKIAKSECCNRGCRFYKIADLVGATKQLELNYSRNACHNSCFESYSESSDRDACNLGCDTMASQKLMYTASEFMWSFLIRNRKVSSDDQAVAGELMEPDDLLMDLALKRQLISNSGEHKKLPLVHKKTLPLDMEPDEFERWWANCTFRYISCLRFSLLTVAAFMALYHTFCSTRLVEPTKVLPTTFSDEALPLPPKYSFMKEEIKV